MIRVSHSLVLLFAAFSGCDRGSQGVAPEVGGMQPISVRVRDTPDSKITILDPTIIDVTGDDYCWHVAHPGMDGELGTQDDQRMTRNIHVPVDTKIRLRLHSRDYVYTLALPDWGLREIAVPELEFGIEFRAPQPGRYRLWGDQQCGFTHPQLLGTLHVHHRIEYARWLCRADQAGEAGDTRPADTAASADRAAPRAPPNERRVPPFDFTDQFGHTYGSDDLWGNVWVATFVFTRCQATCPTQFAQLARLQSELRGHPRWSRIRLVAISVDPEHDTPQVMRAYSEQIAGGVDPVHWKMLTGSPYLIEQLSIQGFRLPVTVASGTLASASHSHKFVLVDGVGRVRDYYDGTSQDEVNRLLFDIDEIWRDGPE